MKLFLKIFTGLIISFVILILGLGFWLYNGSLSSDKIKAFGLLPFPIAIVNGSFIPADQFITRYNISQEISPDTATAKIISELLNEKKVSLVAQKHGVDISGREIDLEYNNRSQQPDFEGKKSFEKLLTGYGISKNEYENNIIKPYLLQNDLQTWFFSKPDLNSQAYAQANDLVQRIQKGDNINDLSAQYSEQNLDKQTQGDLGFVDPTELLPELKESADSMSVGDIKIIPSHYGLHILKLEAKKNNLLHLKQIFINGSDFNVWYSNEIKNYKVWQLLKT